MKRIRDGKPQKNGKAAEYKVAQILLAHGRKVKRCAYRSPFDLLVDGKWKCDVKVSYLSTRHAPRRSDGTGMLYWLVNFHRHGKLSETCDFYIVRLEKVPGFQKAVHLLLPSPVKVLTQRYGLRSLIEKGAPFVQNFKRLCAGDRKFIEKLLGQ